MATTVTGTNVSCNGAANGSASAAVTGGTAPYTYSWTGGATTASISGLSGNTYNVTVTDNHGCSVTGSYTVTEPAALTSSVTGTNVNCHGAANGTATVTVTGGSTPYTYLWSNFQSTASITGLSGGTYYVVITDNHGCTKRDSIVIAEPAAITLATTVTNVNCNGGTGTITLTANGGTTPYAFSWSNSATTQNITTTAGTYTVTVTDNHSCTATASATIIQPAVLALTDSITNPSCNGSTNGDIALTVTGGTTPYTYHWNTGANTANVNNLAAGSYQVTVSDAHGCSLTASYTVVQPAAITSTVTGTDATCFGAANGTASLSVSGGSAPYSYLWSNFAHTANLSGLTAGLYRVNITDAHGCQAYDSIIIHQPSAITLSVAATNVLCSGNATGAVNLTVSGGTPVYHFAWSNGATSQNISGLTVGTFRVTVTDNNGCTAIDSAVITQPTPIVASGVAVNVHCAGGNDGSVELSVSGGVAPYAYHWNNGASTETVNGLGAGPYTVTITDLNGCSATLAFNISNPTPITSSVTSTNIACHGVGTGTANLTVNGGTPPYTFFWSNFQVTQNISGLSGGIYYVIITDSAGCTHRDSAIVTEPSLVILTANVGNITCFNSNNGSINLVVTGGNPIYSYIWNTGATTQNLSGLSGGTYSVTVTDGNGCTTTNSFVLGNPAQMVTNFVVHNVSCFGGNNGYIDVIQSGGTPNYTFRWNTAPVDTTQDITGLSAGTYIVTVVDSRGCTNIDSATVTEPGQLYTSGVTKNVTCHGDSDGAVIIVPYGGTLPYSFNWSSGPSTQDLYNVTGGNYYVTVTDANLCQVASLYEVFEPSILSSTIVSTNATCFGSATGKAAIIPAGGTTPYQYQWNDFYTDSSRTGLLAGRYVVLLTDSNGCHLYDSINITQPTQIVVSGIITNATCYNTPTGSVNISVSGGNPGYTYLWTTTATSQNLNSVTSGTYTVVVTDQSNCSVADSFAIDQPAEIFLAFLTDKPNCYGGANGSVSVVAQQGLPPYTYQWNTSPAQTTATASDLTAGTYAVTVTDSKACSVSGSQVLIQPDSIHVATNVTSAHCFNTASGKVIATVSGGSGPYVYQLNGVLQSSDTFAGLLPGNYILLATDLNGCDGQGSFKVNAPNQISVSLSVSDQIILTGMKTQLIANATSDTTIIHYFWSPLTLDSSPVFDFSNCGDSTNCATPYVSPPFTNVFTVTVENADSCFASDTITIFVNKDATIFIPTAFTPNGDGLNDRFTFDILGATTVEVSIFDRWGERVYYNPAQSNGVGNANGWDGTKNGKAAPEDTYVYQLRITYYDGKTTNKAGTVTLMR